MVDIISRAGLLAAPALPRPAVCRLVARPEPRAPSGTFCARRLVARRRPHTAGALMRIGPATCRRFRHFRRVFYVQALFFRLLVVRFVMQADDLHTSRWRRTGPAAAARTASPGARPRRSPGGAGQSFLDGPAAGLTSRPAAPRRRAAEAPASPARIRGPIAGSRRLGGGAWGGCAVWPCRANFGRLGPEVPAPADCRYRVVGIRVPASTMIRPRQCGTRQYPHLSLVSTPTRI